MVQEEGEDGVRRRVGQRLGSTLRGKYVLERVLGVGGMAAVYEATNTRVGRRCAVKMLHPELSLISEVQSRFLREGLAANAVGHRGVVDVLDSDVAEDGSAFLVMEFLEGESLESTQERLTLLDVATVLRVGHEVCAALEGAHANGIVHRDIKPANLFLTGDGRLKILDFGIARVRDAQSGGGMTQAGATLGTPAFMAPEQARGAMAEIGPRTDLWAVGATLFTLLSGRFVHEGVSGQELIIKSATTPPRSLASVAPTAPPLLVSIVDKALHFAPSERWEDAQTTRVALAGAFRELVRDGGAVDGPIRLAKAPPATSAYPSATRTVPLTPSPRPTQPPTKISGEAPRVGSVTEQPTSSEPSPRRGSRVLGVAAAGLAGAAVIAVLVVSILRTTRASPVGVVSTSVAPTTSTPITTSSLASTASIVSGMADASVEPSSPSSAAFAQPPPTKRAPPARSAGPRPSNSAPPVVKPGCDPNYVLDSEGNKRFKPECFQ